MTNTGIPAPALTSISRKIPRALAHQVELLITRLIKTPTNNNIPAIIMLITLIKAIITCMFRSKTAGVPEQIGRPAGAK